MQLSVHPGLLAGGEGRLAVEVLLAEEAEVVLPSLEEGESRLHPERLHERDVLVGELLLQRLGGGGDDHLEAAARRGEQVGEGLSRSGARFDHQRPPLRQRALDLPGHGELRGSRLERGQRPLELALEEIGQRRHAWVLPRQRR